jgi:phosphoribosylanthranilate isomerase
MLVKVCGITNLEDALAAVECGADMLGFVFAPSPRRISPGDAARITAILPPHVGRVGVFVNETAQRIGETVRLCGLDFAQLHGDESPGFARGLSVPFIRAFRARDESVLEGIAAFGADTFLLDAYDPHRAGGTGKLVNLDIAAKAAKLGNMILAGGLNPDNVARAVEVVRPYGVDVSSGVESSPGRKDHDRIMRFISEAKR